MGDMADLAGDRAFDEWNEGHSEDGELPEGFIRGKRGVQRKEYATEEIPRPAPSAASDPNRDPRYDPARAPSPYEERSAAQDREHRLAAGSASANHPEADRAPDHPAATASGHR